MRLHYDFLAKSRLLGTSQLKALLSEAEQQMKALDAAAQAAEAKAHNAVSALEVMRSERDQARDQIVALNQRYDAAVAGHALQLKAHENSVARLTNAADTWANRAQAAEKRPTQKQLDIAVAASDSWRDKYREIYAWVEIHTKGFSKFPRP